ncbi:MULTISPECIES: LysR family transcriptional regulator [Mycobacterium]|uniref:LysR family transcriptional regulator n=1 Tax=Mycobacterium TaxID=1763 RepID=UPI0003588E2C|nr:MULTISPECIES: LysR family transcriptional regulator [Mycobacterium]EPQ48677.1 transcriptional regulator, LysR family [Mycobacterium sp. 012931]BEH75926.1 transcriptional regulator [Mycobacterium pseudoshottsii]
MLNLQRVVVLHELQRRGTLAAVAKALSYSPSAVSQQLAQLERECGMALIEPVGRGVRLTDAGEALVEHTRLAIATLERAEALLAASQGRVAGRLRVAAFQTLLLSLLPRVLDALARDYPDLRVEVAQREADGAISGLLAGTFDVVLGEEYPGGPLPPSPSLDRVDLRTDELFLAMPRIGPWSDATTLSDLEYASWALDPEPTVPGRWARSVCRAAGFEPDVRFDGVDLLVHLQMVQAGLAVAILPALLGQDRMRGVRLAPLPASPKRQLFTLTRTSRTSHPAVVAFRTALAEGFDAQHQYD